MISGRHSIEIPIETFFDLVTLTYKLDLDILPLDLHAKIQVCVCQFGRESGNTQTHTQKHRRCQNYYTRQVTDLGCKKLSFSEPIPPITFGKAPSEIKPQT